MIEIETDASDELTMLSASIKKFGNFREPMLKWIRYMQTEKNKLFNANALGGTYDGIHWPYFSPKTLEKISMGRRMYRFTRPSSRTLLKDGDKILNHTGQLKRSLTNSKLFRITNNYIEFGTTVDYAVYHQEGTPGNKFPMPARPILTATDKNLEYFDRLISQHLKASMRRKNGRA